MQEINRQEKRKCVKSTWWTCELIMDAIDIIYLLHTTLITDNNNDWLMFRNWNCNLYRITLLWKTSLFWRSMITSAGRGNNTKNSQARLTKSKSRNYGYFVNYRAILRRCDSWKSLECNFSLTSMRSIFVYIFLLLMKYD